MARWVFGQVDFHGVGRSYFENSSGFYFLCFHCPLSTFLRHSVPSFRLMHFGPQFVRLSGWLAAASGGVFSQLVIPPFPWPAQAFFP